MRNKEPVAPAVTLPQVPKLAHERMAVTIADGLKSLIISGELQPGDRIPNETDLAAHFGVSRISVRESMQMLLALGLVEMTRGRGTFVREPDPDERMRDLAYFSFERDPSVSDLFEVRSLLEARSALRAATHEPASERLQLEQMIAKMRPLAHNAHGDPARLAELDIQFHLAIARLCGNRVLEQLMRRLMQIMEILNVRSLSVLDHRIESWDQHRKIAEAVVDGQPDLAVAHVLEHIAYVRATTLHSSEDDRGDG